MKPAVRERRRHTLREPDEKASGSIVLGPAPLGSRLGHYRLCGITVVWRRLRWCFRYERKLMDLALFVKVLGIITSYAENKKSMIQSRLQQTNKCGHAAVEHCGTNNRILQLRIKARRIVRPCYRQVCRPRQRYGKDKPRQKNRRNSQPKHQPA